jgi:hypothetical protein
MNRERRDISDKRSGNEEKELKTTQRRRDSQRRRKREGRRRDPSTTRPDAPNCGAKEKVGPLRSG